MAKPESRQVDVLASTVAADIPGLCDGSSRMGRVCTTRSFFSISWHLRRFDAPASYPHIRPEYILFGLRRILEPRSRGALLSCFSILGSAQPPRALGHCDRIFGLYVRHSLVVGRLLRPHSIRCKMEHDRIPAALCARHGASFSEKD